MSRSSAAAFNPQVRRYHIRKQTHRRWIKCDLCGSDAARYLFQKEDFNFVQCEHCGLLYINPQPSDEEISDIYGEHYYDAWGLDVGEDHVRDLKTRTFRRLLGLLKSETGAGAGRLLDIGCAHGQLMEVARSEGYDPYGVELNVDAARRAQQSLGANRVHQGTLDDHPFEAGSFDVVVMCDLLEHVRSPRGLLAKAHDLLRPDGALVILTPNAQSLSSRLLGGRWTDFKAEHLYYFSPKTLRQLLGHSSFRVRAVSSFPKFLNLVYLDRQLTRYHTPFFSECAAALRRLSPEPLALRPFPIFAGSMVAVAQKATRARTRPKLSILMPVYNEQATLREILDAVLQKEVPGVDKEIIVVESNSTDGCREIVKEYERQGTIRALYQDAPRGKGNAVREGLRHATGDIILIQDSDLEYDVNDYDSLVGAIVDDGEDFVLGSRHLGKASWKIREFTENPALALTMNLGHQFFTGLYNLLYGQRVADPTTMLKVFRRDCLDGVPLEADRFDFDWELIAKLARLGYTPKEIPVNYRSRSYAEGKKVRFARDPLTWVRAIVKFRFASLGDRGKPR